MIESEHIDLINRDLDGLLSEPEKDKLRKILASDDAAKRYHSDLRKTFGILKNIEKVDPDPNLKKSILNTIPADKYATKTKTGFVRSLSTVFGSKSRHGTLLSFSAGFALGMILLVVIIKISGIPTVSDSDVVGSLILSGETNSFKLVGRFEVSHPEVAGTFALKARGNLILLEAKSSAESEMEFSLNYDANALALRGIRFAEDGENRSTISTNSIRLYLNGQTQWLAVFDRKAEDETHLRLTMRIAGRSYEHTLDVPSSQSHQ